MSGQWISIAIETDGDHAQAIATDLRLTAGCKGVRIDEPNAQSGIVTLTSYVSCDETGEAIVNAIQASLIMLPILGVDGVSAPAIIGRVDEEDWAHGWKKYFKPIRIGKHLIVTPPWASPTLLDDDIKIIIDPGMAFGTGTHPTTQLCLEGLENHLQRGDSVADIGTGSGILSIAAAQLGASTVVSVDNDPLAVRIAAKNAKVNDVDIATSGDFPSDGHFDIVVANIIADTLIELCEPLCRITKPNGVLIVSGIIDTREQDVADTFVARGCTLIETHRASEWVALVCRRGET